MATRRKISAIVIRIKPSSNRATVFRGASTKRYRNISKSTIKRLGEMKLETMFFQDTDAFVVHVQRR